jgi:hypothetical protein
VYSTLLHANGEDVKVVQELLRHGSVKVTMDVLHAGVYAGQTQSAAEACGDDAPRSKEDSGQRSLKDWVLGGLEGFPLSYL